MPAKNTVIRSINQPGEALCVDVFRRPDDSFGFQEYRRDPEDNRGWYSTGHHGQHGAARFETYEDALLAAQNAVAWLSDAMDP